MLPKVLAITDWLKTMFTIVSNITANPTWVQTMSALRGQVFNCHLGENLGDEKNKHRPVLVVSINNINLRSTTLIVAPLSKTLKRRPDGGPRLASHYFLNSKKYTFLSADSAVQCEDMRSITKARLTQLLGQIDQTDMEEIEKRLRYVLGLVDKNKP